MTQKFARFLCASVLASSMFAAQASASQYIYDWETRILTFDGAPTEAIDFSVNGSFLFTISFSGGWLSGDNYFELETVTRNDSRVRFTYLPELNVGSGLPISTSFLDFTQPVFCANEYKVRSSSFDALLSYNNERCGGESTHVRKGGYFVAGYGEDDAASTYRVDISPVPLPAGAGLLLSALTGLSYLRFRKRRTV